MATPIVFDNTVFPAGYADTHSGDATSNDTVSNLNPFDITLNGTINKVGDTVTATGNGGSFNKVFTATNFDNNGMIEFTSGQFTYIVSNTPLTKGQMLSFQQDNLQSYTVCFCSGTSLLAVADVVPVEKLAAGDMVVTHSGARRVIRWIGHRTIKCRSHPRPHEVMPIAISAHAFGENRPTHDLFVSPGHAICIDMVGEVLIPAGLLVNGSTIVQVEVDEVTYWHVELDSHDILLAENLPAESYLEMGNRGFFREADVVDLAAGPDPVDTARRTHADFCRPYVDRGPIFDTVKMRLWERSLALGSAHTRAERHVA